MYGILWRQRWYTIIQQANKNAQIILMDLPHRYDDPSLNEKIDKINVFIAHKCKKTANVHHIKHSFVRSDFNGKGLHLNLDGKKKLAESIKEVVISNSSKC